ncbi:16S rRNA (guanine(527)-N(7))-methyltransferase RsmG [Halovulum dunhuangense]|uniref:Ribosomal RNA small subunit methyltransferase G n=2 Tax=Halovulum dunhuangense TaxID=1505036 RepID=A0A849L041_9RHOB|nr:16S rRNA (guanine(527)-N(7))-methyltransferase RsmG [Halovulum dunhuangense]
MGDADALQRILAEMDVSRETTERLKAYVDLLLKWTKRINLIGKGTTAEIWDRHILDSTQLWPLRPPHARIWLDMGSGGGLPGVVIAILAAEQARDLDLTLMESDLRKSVFLQTVARELGLAYRVVTERIENAAPVKADVVSARALAPLGTLLAWTERHRAQNGTALLLKGRRYQDELTEARALWHVEPEVIQSRSDPSGVILRIGDFRRV